MSSSKNTIPVRVSGNIISEFSDKVPSYIFAINEILKNSYDACATSIDIKYDEVKNKLEITDNGTGIAIYDLSALFHISKSSKAYGRKICDNNRFEQGEKGLGLLAVFKFGNSVKWITKHDSYSKPIEFQVDKKQFISEDNLTDHVITYEDSQVELEKGTRLIISDFEEQEKQVINSFFKDESNISKISNLFLDESIIVNYFLNSIPQKISNLNKIIENNNAPERFDVIFDSRTSQLQFKKNNQTLKVVEFTEPCPSGMVVKTKFKILNLRGSSKDNVDKIFHDPIDRTLKPLVFVNNVWFNNFNLFNPEITRKIGGSATLPQIIGYLTIDTTQSQIQFNADRTEFIENIDSLALRKYLESLNVFIQKQGSLIKDSKSIEDNDNSSESEDKKNQLDLGLDAQEKDPALSELQNQIETENKNNLTKPTGKIEVSCTSKTINFYQSSITFDLFDLIDEFTINGSHKNKEELEIYIDNKQVNDSKLSGITENIIKILQFRYISDTLKIFSKEIKLNFKKKPSKLVSDAQIPPLVKSFSFEYTIDLPIVGTLIEQINGLWLESKEYKVIIATTLRVVFELSTKYFFDRTSEGFNSNRLEEKVEHIVELIFNYNQDKNNGNPDFYKKITREYSNFKNVYAQPTDFKNKVVKSNLGSHGATDNLTTDDIESIAKYAGYYAQLVDAYLKEKGV